MIKFKSYDISFFPVAVAVAGWWVGGGWGVGGGWVAGLIKTNANLSKAELAAGRC